jgi:hypothetical protein
VRRRRLRKSDAVARQASSTVIGASSLKGMVPRGGIEPPTLRFSEAERSRSIKGLAFLNLEKRVGFGLWMAKASASAWAETK